MVSSMKSAITWQLASQSFATFAFLVGMFAILFAVVFGIIIVMWETSEVVPPEKAKVSLCHWQIILIVQCEFY